MAITRTIQQLAADLRIGDGETAPTGAAGVVLARIDATAKALINAYAPNAPTAIQNEAYARLAGWLYDTDPSGRTGSPDALKNSGAAYLLAPYRSKRGGIIAAGDGAAASTTTPTGEAGVDQTARNAAAAAQAAADANTTFLSTFAARVRAVVEAVVPSWARATNPPASALGSIPAYNSQGADGSSGTYAAGNVVRRSNVVYLCTQTVNVANFGSLYAPGTGSAWQSRWVRLGVPSGGTANQALAKSADNSAVAWRAVSTLIANGSITVGKLAAALVARLLPTGGSDGQILGRASGSPAWVAAPQGTGGADATARAGVDANQAQIRGLQDVTRDLHLHDESAMWRLSNDAANTARLAITTGSDYLNLTYSAGKITKPGGGWPAGLQKVVARVPNGADISQYRVHWKGTDARQSLYGGGNLWTRITETPTDDTTYDYYLTRIRAGVSAAGIGEDVQFIEIEHYSELHQTTFDGLLGAGIVKLLNLASEVVSRLLPTGGANGKFLGYTGGSPAWVDAPGGGTEGVTEFPVFTIEGSRGLTLSKTFALGSYELAGNGELAILWDGQFTGAEMKLGYRFDSGSWSTTNFSNEATARGGLFLQGGARFDGGGGSGRTVTLRLIGTHASNTSGFTGLVRIMKGGT